jgi:hypothetical protein
VLSEEEEAIALEFGISLHELPSGDEFPHWQAELIVDVAGPLGPIGSDIYAQSSTAAHAIRRVLLLRYNMQVNPQVVDGTTLWAASCQFGGILKHSAFEAVIELARMINAHYQQQQ